MCKVHKDRRVFRYRFGKSIIMLAAFFPRFTLTSIALLFTLIAITAISVNYIDNAYGLCMRTCQAERLKELENKTVISENSTTINGKIIKVASLVAEGKIRGTYGNFVVIEPSRTCLAQLKANLTTKCPDMKELEKFDTTIQKISGKFEYDKNGFYHRGKPQYKNYQLSYQPTKYPLVVCVDCSEQIFKVSKRIIIEASNYTYTDNKDNTIKNFTRYEYRNISVKGCQEVTMAYNPVLLNATINYLKNGCTDKDFNKKIEIYMTPKPIGDKMQYKEYQYQAALKEKIKQAQELAKLKCKNKCDDKVR